MTGRSWRRTALAALLLLVTQGCAGWIETAAQPLPSATASADSMLAELRAQMVIIPAGTFRMGSESPAAAEDERPVRVVSLRSFAIGRYEITARQYALFAATTARSGGDVADRQDHPAVNVSWDDAQAFIAWLNALSGEGYRLPTEAEWEYAARGGTQSEYWWGDDFAAEHVNGTGLHGPDRWLETAPVGQFAPNPFGLYDMLGNVWEWTADCYHADYAQAPLDGSARSGEPDCGRVLRGGSWSDIPAWLRAATRNWFERGDRFDYIGLRLARDL